MLLEKIEQFLFDVIGLCVPGFLFLLIPVWIVSIAYDYSILTIFSTIENLKIFIENNNNYFNNTILSVMVVLLSYLFGHIVKVLSIRFYDFFKTLFDDNINIFTKLIIEKIKLLGKKIRNYFQKFLVLNSIILIFSRIFNIFINLLKKFLLDLFIFKPQDYDNSCKLYEEKLVEYLKNQEIIPDKELDKRNYPIYKLSCIIQDNEGIKTLTRTFLAKYNFYRSLAFIAFANILFIAYILNFKHAIHTTAITELMYLLILFYFVFHYKYKRYWMLSGNEAVMALYYYYFLKNKSFK